MIKNRSAPFLFITFILLATSLYAYSHERYKLINRKAIKEYRNIIKNRGGWLILGESEKGNPVFYREFGSGNKTTLIVGGIHGDEPASTTAVIKLAQLIERNPAMITEKALLIACINPDGLISGTRTNSRGVDINRNFPAHNWSPGFTKRYLNPGPEPASEKETRLLIKILEEYNPQLLIHMHQPFNTIYATKPVPEELTEKMASITGLPVKEDVWYSTPGSLGSYAVSGKFSIPEITFEMGPINVEPDYKSIIASLVTAINYNPESKK